MRFVLLSFAFCAAIQAAPLSRLEDPNGAALNPETNILLGRSGYLVGEVGDVVEEARSLSTYEDADHALANEEEECDMDETNGEDTHPADLHASSISGNTSFAESSEPEEDPELLEILLHVEDILDSDAPADEQIQWMLDAILHHSESWRGSHDDLWSDEEILRLVNEVVADAATSAEEKVQTIFAELLVHTKHKANVDSPVHEPVLYRIRAIFYGAESSQKKIKKMLNEIADYMNSALKTTGAAIAPQVSLGGAESGAGGDAHVASEAERDAERILERIALEESKESGWS